MKKLDDDLIKAIRAEVNKYIGPVHGLGYYKNNISIIKPNKNEEVIRLPKDYEVNIVYDDPTDENNPIAVMITKREENSLPDEHEKLVYISGYYTTSTKKGARDPVYMDNMMASMNDTIFPTLELARAAGAMAQLSQLREVYRNGWVPNWGNEGQNKHCIHYYNDKLDTTIATKTSYFLAFQTQNIMKLFLENFKDLIEQAKPLLQ